MSINALKLIYEKFDERKRINNCVEYGRLEILTKKICAEYIRKENNCGDVRLEISPKKHV